MEDAADLLNNLRSDIQYTGQLVEILSQQRKAFEEREIDKFESLTVEQEPLFYKLVELQNSRNQMLKRHNFELTPYGLQQLIATLPQNYQKQIAELWVDLKEHHDQLERLTFINKNLIEIGHAQVTRVLDVLYDRGEQTYGPNAQPVKASGTRPLSEI